MPTPTTPFQLTDQFNMANFNEKIADTNTYIQEMVAAAQAAGAKIQTGSYVGTGTYGQANPCSLTFDFVPALLIVWNSNINATPRWSPYGYYGSDIGGRDGFVWTVGSTENPAYQNQAINTFTQEGNTVSWAALSASTTSAAYQFNGAGYLYAYIAIG